MIFWPPTAGLQWPPSPFHKILVILTMKEQTCLRLIPKNNRKSNKSFCSDMLCSHGQLSSSQWAYPLQKISLYLFWQCHTEQKMIFHLDPCNLESNAFSLSLRPPFFFGRLPLIFAGSKMSQISGNVEKCWEFVEERINFVSRVYVGRSKSSGTSVPSWNPSVCTSNLKCVDASVTMLSLVLPLTR